MRKSASEKKTGTRVDTISFTHDEAAAWPLPVFQRPLRVNAKVRELAASIGSDGGVIPGIITFGELNGKRYLIDGQHRREAFLLSEKEVGYADVRICEFNSMAAMGQEFVDLNSRLVSMRPDDVLRGLESANEHLVALREACPFIGYDNVRRSPQGTLLSMSVAIRCWRQSAGDVPTATAPTATVVLETMTAEDTQQMISFLQLVIGAWGRDLEYARLWSSLNMVICMWLYRRLVLSKDYSARTKQMTTATFKHCLTALSADSNYLDWLVGRNLCDRDRSPAYSRIKNIFVRRVQHDTGQKIILPQPAWAHT